MLSSFSIIFPIQNITGEKIIFLQSKCIYDAICISLLYIFIFLLNLEHLRRLCVSKATYESIYVVREIYAKRKLMG